MGNPSPDHQTDLYFIALVPTYKLRERVKALKMEMKARFNTAKALNSPAHITLQMPFKRRVDEEPYLLDTLQAFAENQKPFSVRLSGFDCFAPRVIFVKVLDQEPIGSLHTQLQKVLTDKLGLNRKALSQNFHPHMTIANRDLSVEAFHKAWGEFEKREFEASFLANSLFLLKHNGKSWEIHREFRFKTSPLPL